MRNRAFTLLELLVVIAIIGLLLTLLAPSITNMLTRSRTAICGSNLKEVRKALQLTASKPDLSGIITGDPLPDPMQWPAIAYKAVPTLGMYLCPEDEEREFSGGSGTIPGMIYKSAIAPYMDIPIENGTFCKSRRGTDAEGSYTEFVVEENTGHYSANGYACFGAEFWSDRPWYPSGPNWSDNDGVFRFYDGQHGVRKFKLQYCTCSLDNKLYYYEELIWHPLKFHVGASIDLYINDVYTSYGFNSAIVPADTAPDTILALDYPDRMAWYTEFVVDKTIIADNLDAVSQRHGGRVNVLFNGGSVQAMGASEVKPTINSAPWTP